MSIHVPCDDSVSGHVNRGRTGCHLMHFVSELGCREDPTLANLRATIKRGAKSFNSYKYSRSLFVWASLTPILLYFLVFAIIPVGMSLYISLHRWSYLENIRQFTGLENYVKVWSDPRFLISLKNTTLYAVCYMTFVISIGLALALLVHSTHPWIQRILRPIYFAPQVTSAVAIALMFTWLYQPQWGVLNYLLGFIGLGPYMWLQSSAQVMPAIIIVGVWHSVGYSMVIFTAGLLNIPTDLREAAAIDGADAWHSFWRIVLPLLQPTLLFMVVTSMIGGFQVFTEVWLMSHGGPGTASRVLVLDIYDYAFRYFEMGHASAIAFYLFMIVAVMAFFQLRYMRESFEF
jgi:multiple sugar transport system permease protein